MKITHRTNPNGSLHGSLSLTLLLALILIGCSRGPSAIRVQNQTGADLVSVTVDTNSFGSVKSEATSDYQTVQAVSEQCSVRTESSDGGFRSYRFVGGENKQRSSGRYTYVLTVDTNKTLQVNLRKD